MNALIMNLDLDSIIAECQAGQKERFGVLYDLYIKQVYGFIYQKTWHRETAEDLTSQTFVKALKNIGQFNADKASFKTWLYTIARNTVIDHYRISKDEVAIDNVLDLGDDADVKLDLDNRELLAKVRLYLDGIAVRQRQIILMRIWEGLSYQEIAEIVGLQEDNCKMIFHRAMLKLRNDLAVLAIYLLIIFKLYVS